MIEFAEMTSKWINIIYVWLEVIYIYTYIHTYIRLSWCTICRDIFTCEYLGHESSNKAGSSGVFHNSYPSGEPRQPRCHEDQEIFFSCNHCSLILGDTRWVSNTSRTKNLWNTKCRVLGSRMVVSKKTLRMEVPWKLVIWSEPLWSGHFSFCHHLKPVTLRVSLLIPTLKQMPRVYYLWIGLQKVTKNQNFCVKGRIFSIDHLCFGHRIFGAGWISMRCL